jgi:hypothetical protein
MEKFAEYLEEARKTIQILDHMVYITFPLIKDKRLLLKILLDVKIAISKCINSILQYEYIYKKINLCQNPKTNFRTFTEQCAKKYNITKEEILLIKELFNLVEKHNQSPFEFVRNDKIIILSENLKQNTLTIEKIKEFLILAKNVLNKAEKIIRG